MFATLGVRVTLIEKRPRLLEFADQEIIEALSYHLRDHRVTMRLNEEVSSVEDGGTGVTALLESKKKVTGDSLLYAVGRGVQKNMVEAAAWNLAAAGQGLSDAWLDQTLSGLSADERTRAERLANERIEQR